MEIPLRAGQAGILRRAAEGQPRQARSGIPHPLAGRDRQGLRKGKGGAPADRPRRRGPACTRQGLRKARVRTEAAEPARNQFKAALWGRAVRLRDKVAVVTGASSDIGRSIVKRFVQEGARVVLVGRNLESLEAARKEAGGDPDATVSMVCDVTDVGQVEQVANQVAGRYGRIDVLVNGAGALNDPVHFHEMRTADIKSMIHSNMLGVLFPTRAVLSKMVEAGSGAIVNVASIAGQRAIPRVHLAAYSSTKAAVIMFTRSIAVEYARRNIRCNCISPGIVRSGMIKPFLDDPGARSTLENSLPISRIGEPEDVANAVLFMASDEASWITGTVLEVDGGKSASES